MIEFNEAALKARQLEEWSDSVFLTPEEFAQALTLKNARYTNVDGSKIDTSFAIERYKRHFPNAVPYKCGKLGDEKAGFDGTGFEYLGLRFGLEGSEYLSF